MAKLRRMLGNINDEIIVELMRVIETQSKETISLWAVNYVEQNILNIYEKESNSDLRLREVIISTKEYLRGNMKLKEIKEALREVKTIPKEVEENPVAQASARAILTACATIQTPTNALGFTFYSVAAIVYNQVGVKEKVETYDKLAVNEFVKVLESLQEVAIKNEVNPVKISWNC
ncbi:Uncharacterised protein [uncultured Clostridium sp.]|uniref:putative immunity protein n=1 Tax=uncultured Clostridium sp. TaxID=59620 RepID=UPI000820AE44|nr:hypothetical protein [uncultured Clostridium sp.]SCK04608.1 Uncharacterised protein [uncultured Clostridium sp.]